MKNEPIQICLRETDPLDWSGALLERWIAEAERLLRRMKGRDDAETTALRWSLERELRKKRGKPMLAAAAQRLPLEGEPTE